MTGQGEEKGQVHANIGNGMTSTDIALIGLGHCPKDKIAFTGSRYGVRHRYRVDWQQVKGRLAAGTG